MPRQVRSEYPERCIMSRGNRRQDICLDDVDRQHLESRTNRVPMNTRLAITLLVGAPTCLAANKGSQLLRTYF
jgi:hypothetical protein